MKLALFYFSPVIFNVILIFIKQKKIYILSLECMVMVSPQPCPTLCCPMDHSLPGSSVHGILQARIWIGLPYTPSGNLPDPGIEPTI